MKFPERPFTDAWVRKLLESYREFMKRQDAEAHKSWSWGKGGGAARHNVSDKVLRYPPMDFDCWACQQVYNATGGRCPSHTPSSEKEGPTDA